MLPLAGAFIAMIAVVLVMLVELGVRTVERADAQTAADMAALAAVHEGRPGADDLATRNGAELVDFAQVNGSFYVEVRLGGARAEAWAELDWTTIPIPEGGS